MLRRGTSTYRIHVRLSILDTSTAVGIVSVPKKVGAGNLSPSLELSEDVSFGIGNPLGCREIGLGKVPQVGGDTLPRLSVYDT